MTSSYTCDYGSQQPLMFLFLVPANQNKKASKNIKIIISGSVLYVELF